MKLEWEAFSADFNKEKKAREDKTKNAEMQKRMSGAKGELDKEKKAITNANNAINRLKAKIKKSKSKKQIAGWTTQIEKLMTAKTTAEVAYKTKRTAYNKITQEKVAATKAKEAEEAKEREANQFADTEREANRMANKAVTLQNQL